MRHPETNLVSWLFSDQTEEQAGVIQSYVSLLEMIRRVEQIEAWITREADLKQKFARIPDRIDFRGSCKKSFPVREIDELEFERIDSDKLLLRVSTFVMGLHGHSGVMPKADWDFVANRKVEDYFLRFLDIFENRQIRKFYHAWRRNRIDISAERVRMSTSSIPDSDVLRVPQETQEVDLASEIYSSLIGVLIPELRESFLFPDRLLIGLSSHLGRPVRSADSLLRCIAAQYQIPISLRQFVKCPMVLPTAARTRIGSKASAKFGIGGNHHRLGIDAILGKICVDYQSRYELILGPLSDSHVEQFSPHNPGSHFKKVCQFLQFYGGATLNFDIRFLFQQETVNRIGRTRLGRHCESPEGQVELAQSRSILGFNTWLLAGDSGRDRDDPLLRFSWSRESINIINYSN